MEGSVSGLELGSVIVGIDGSLTAHRAALWAADEAARRERPLHLLYAADTGGRALYVSTADIERIHNVGRELLRDTAAALAERCPRLSVTTEFSRSAPVPSLHRSAGRRGTIVVGNRGLGGFSSLMLGSVGLKVAAGAKTPVVVVRGTDNGIQAGAVLVAVRDEKDLDCVRYAAREAELRKSPLRLLHVETVLRSVGNVGGTREDLRGNAGDDVRPLAAIVDRIREEYPNLTLQADTSPGVSVAGVLVETSHRAELLVMGGRRSPGSMGPTLGRATHSLLHHAQCPVLLIPRHAKGPQEK
ncbi:universal stress protein [Streptomyces katrae]|uniref:universal stress protein n=1 Tax=Streptomyces katrae TaxID=68223 RepID=UPI0004C1D5DF|nr:universal stress protein [Streptomyces katrae]